jgi:cyanophycinase
MSTSPPSAVNRREQIADYYAHGNEARLLMKHIIGTCVLALFLLSPAPAGAGGHFVLVGGGILPLDSGREFVRLAGGKDARIVVIPSASLRANPEANVRRWRRILGVSITVLHARTTREAAQADLYKCLDKATGVWMGGGDQCRLTQLFAGTVLTEKLRSVLARGGVVGGTSAGASVVTRVMVNGTGVARGFGLLDGCVIDQHFTQRKRYERLKRIIDEHPKLTGFGIDVNTALVISGKDYRVIGSGTVTRYANGRNEVLPRRGALFPGAEAAQKK